MIKVNLQDAKTHLSRYLDQVEKGGVVVLCRHNKPVAELRTFEVETVPMKRVAGLLKGRIQWESNAFAPLTDSEAEAFDSAGIFPATALPANSL